jgi:hypothetical protein
LIARVGLRWAKARIGVSMEAVVAGLATVDFTQHKQQSPRALAFLQQVPKAIGRSVSGRSSVP